MDFFKSKNVLSLEQKYYYEHLLLARKIKFSSQTLSDAFQKWQNVNSVKMEKYELKIPFRLRFLITHLYGRKENLKKISTLRILKKEPVFYSLKNQPR